MQLFRKVRRLDTWSRALLVGFVLAFGLNAIAHASHRHEPASATTSLHATACGHCLSFDHLASGPAGPALHSVVNVDVFVVLPLEASPRASLPHSTARARAPPILI